MMADKEARIQRHNGCTGSSQCRQSWEQVSKTISGRFVHQLTTCEASCSASTFKRLLNTK